MYLQRLRVGVEDEVAHKEEVVLQRVNRPATTALARAYATRAREDPDIPGVIVVTFTLFNIDLYALINPLYAFIYMHGINE